LRNNSYILLKHHIKQIKFCVYLCTFHQITIGTFFRPHTYSFFVKWWRDILEAKWNALFHWNDHTIRLCIVQLSFFINGCDNPMVSATLLIFSSLVQVSLFMTYILCIFFALSFSFLYVMHKILFFLNLNFLQLSIGLLSMNFWLKFVFSQFWAGISILFLMIYCKYCDWRDFSLGLKRILSKRNFWQN